MLILGDIIFLFWIIKNELRVYFIEHTIPFKNLSVVMQWLKATRKVCLSPVKSSLTDHTRDLTDYRIALQMIHSSRDGP